MPERDDREKIMMDYSLLKSTYIKPWMSGNTEALSYLLDILWRLSQSTDAIEIKELENKRDNQIKILNQWHDVARQNAADYQIANSRTIEQKRIDAQNELMERFAKGQQLLDMARMKKEEDK